MTLIAGMLSRGDRTLNEKACAHLANSISRNSADEIRVIGDHRSFFVKVDIGAFGEPGIFIDSSGAFSLLAGEPLLDIYHSGSPSSRLKDLTTIHEQGLQKNWDILIKAAGTFSIVHYQPETATLALAADKLGIRPIYYWFNHDLIVFASALRVLEECPVVPKKMNLRAVTEMVGLDTPLADRTPYDGIFLLKPAEVLQVARERISRRCYWRWDEIDVSSESEPARLTAVYENFQSAVNRRVKNDTATRAYLSGGLDSRAVVAALGRRDVQLHTVNFARPGTQDHYCGNQFAERIGSRHQSVPKAQGDRVPDYSLMMAKAIKEFDEKSNQGSQFIPERPRLVWSGEGGSCLLGHIHQSETIVALMRNGDSEGAIDAYLANENINIPAKLFRPHILENAREVIKQGIREELDNFHAADPRPEPLPFPRA